MYFNKKKYLSVYDSSLIYDLCIDDNNMKQRKLFATSKKSTEALLWLSFEANSPRILKKYFKQCSWE